MYLYVRWKCQDAVRVASSGIAWLSSDSRQTPSRPMAIFLRPVKVGNGSRPCSSHAKNNAYVQLSSSLLESFIRASTNTEYHYMPSEAPVIKYSTLIVGALARFKYYLYTRKSMVIQGGKAQCLKVRCIYDSRVTTPLHTPYSMNRLGIIHSIKNCAKQNL